MGHWKIGVTLKECSYKLGEVRMKMKWKKMFKHLYLSTILANISQQKKKCLRESMRKENRKGRQFTKNDGYADFLIYTYSGLINTYLNTHILQKDVPGWAKCFIHLELIISSTTRMFVKQFSTTGMHLKTTAFRVRNTGIWINFVIVLIQFWSDAILFFVLFSQRFNVL